MIVRVAEVAAQAGASQVVVAADSPSILAPVEQAGFKAVLTATDHLSGTDRLAEAASILALADDEIVVNLQGDEPMMPAQVCREVAAALEHDSDLEMSTAAHPIESAADLANPNVVKVVCTARSRAMYFSRAPIPFHRDGTAGWPSGSAHAPQLRHIGIYAYRVGFLKSFPALKPAPVELAESLEQLRALWHGAQIGVVHLADAPPAGVDTPADLERVRAAFS